MKVKTFLWPWLMILVLVGGGCAPTVQRTPEEEAAYQQQLAQQREKAARLQRIQNYPVVLRAECVARDGQVRVNRLQQGPNLCVIKATTHPEFGEIQRMRVVVRFTYADRQPKIEVEDFLPSDKAWSESRISFIQPILMPDSLTGAVVSSLTATATTLARTAVTVAQNLRLNVAPGFTVGFANIADDPKLAPFLDAAGNLNLAKSRFGNLGTRPALVQTQLQICSDVCVNSVVLYIETR